MDSIHIKRFPLKCVVGVYPRERKTRRTVQITLKLYTDLRSSCESDRLADTVDYAALLKSIAKGTSATRYHLIEALAQHIASICLTERNVHAVNVIVEKKGSLPARVAVEINRSRNKD